MSGGGIFDRAWGTIIMEYPIKNSNRTLSKSLDGTFPMKLLRTIKRHQLVRLSLSENNLRLKYLHKKSGLKPDLRLN